MIDNQHCAFGHPSFFSWNPEDSSANDNEALLVEKEDSPPTVGVPEPERYLPRYNPQYFFLNTIYGQHPFPKLDMAHDKAESDRIKKRQPGQPREPGNQGNPCILYTSTPEQPKESRNNLRDVSNKSNQESQCNIRDVSNQSNQGNQGNQEKNINIATGETS